MLVCSTFLGNIKEAFDKDPNLANLLFDDFFSGLIHRCQVYLIYALKYKNVAINGSLVFSPFYCW